MSNNLYFLLIIFSTFTAIAQDTTSVGNYRLILNGNDNKEKTEAECLEKAKLNAIENAFGIYLSDSVVHDASSIRINNDEISKVSFARSIKALVSGKYIRNIDLPVYNYFQKDGFNWLSVTVKGVVRETKPKSFNEDREAMAQYIKDLYLKLPFSDITIVENYQSKFLISVVALDTENYKSQSDMNRVASIVAKSQYNRYLNGSKTEEIFIINTTPKYNKIPIQYEGFSAQKETSSGWVSGSDLLITFMSGDNLQKVFVYSKFLESSK